MRSIHPTQDDIHTYNTYRIIMYGTVPYNARESVTTTRPATQLYADQLMNGTSYGNFPCRIHRITVYLT
jgi:hypothetical protein